MIRFISFSWLIIASFSSVESQDDNHADPLVSIESKDSDDYAPDQHAQEDERINKIEKERREKMFISPDESMYPFAKMAHYWSKNTFPRGELGHDLYVLPKYQNRFRQERAHESSSSAWIIIKHDNVFRPRNFSRINALNMRNDIRISGTCSWISLADGVAKNKSMGLSLPDFIWNTYTGASSSPNYYDPVRMIYAQVPMPIVAHAWFAHYGTGLFSIEQSELDQWISPSATCVYQVPSVRLHALLPDIDDATAERLLRVLAATTATQVAPWLSKMSMQEPLVRMAIANRAIRSGSASQIATCARVLINTADKNNENDVWSFLHGMGQDTFLPSTAGFTSFEQAKKVWSDHLDRLHPSSTAAASGKNP